jgi:DNA-binding transcriptional LysR family regulator
MNTDIHDPHSDDRSPLTTDAALHRIRLRHLITFVAIAQERTFARAAARLHLSQPAVSKTLAELEAIAGRRLVYRGRNGAALSPTGEDFLRYALEVTRALESAAAALTGSIPPVEAAVRVGTLPTAASGLLAEAVAMLRTRRPQAGVTVRTGDNAVLLTWLKAGEIDLAVGRMSEPALMSGVTFELLYAETLVLVTRPGHPLANEPGVAPREVLDYPLIVPAAGTAPRHDADGYFTSHGVALPMGLTETQSASLSRALTLISDTIWVTPQHPVQLDLDRGWLRALSVPAAASVEPVGILSPSGAPQSELAALLLEVLRELPSG